MFCVEDILKEEYIDFSALKLIAGKEGLHREISWPNTIFTLPIAEWLNPGEMVIISGIGMNINEKEMMKMIEQAADGEASCLVIMLNKQYIAEIPQNVIELADMRKLPLFEAPWNLPLGLIMSKVTSFIEKQRLKEKILSQLLFELLSQNTDADSCIERAKMYGYNLEEPHRVILFKIVNIKEILEKKKFNSEAENYTYKNKILRDIEHHFYNGHLKYIKGMQKSSYIFICEVKNLPEEKLLEFLRQIIKNMEHLYPALEIIVGFSRICREVPEYLRGMREARTAVQFIRKEEKINSFEKTGILPWLISDADIIFLKSIYKENLGKLLLADEKKGSELVYTLKEYLKNNGNVVQTAQKMFIHRNTLLKRLEKIEELLDINLEDAYTRNNLFNVLIIGEYL